MGCGMVDTLFERHFEKVYSNVIVGTTNGGERLLWMRKQLRGDGFHGALRIEEDRTAIDRAVLDTVVNGKDETSCASGFFDLLQGPAWHEVCIVKEEQAQIIGRQCRRVTDSARIPYTAHRPPCRRKISSGLVSANGLAAARFADEPGGERTP